MRIAIIGGGISGISTAFLLEKLKKELSLDMEITIIEKRLRWGGSIETSREDGFIVEAGPNGFLDSKPHTLELLSMAGLSNNLVKSNDLARKRYIMRNGILHRLPENPPMFFKSKLLSSSAKMRILSEYFIQKSVPEDESVADFAIRRLGKEALEYLIGPMVSGIFAGDPEKMSLRSCFPVIRDLEINYGGLFKGMIKKKGKKSGPSGPGGILTSYKNGLDNMITDLLESTSITKMLNTEVFSIDKKMNRYILNTNNSLMEFDKIFINTPAYAVSQMLSALDKDLSKDLNGITYPPVFVVGFIFKTEDLEDPLDGFGYLIPHSENKRILGALFDSSIFPDRTRDGYKIVRTIMGGDKNRWIIEKSDDELIRMAFDDIKETLKIKKEPYKIKYFRWEKAIPQYYIGHYKIVEKVEEFCKKFDDIFIGGNILYGVGINDCTKTSFMNVDRFKNLLKK
ncbi:MAG: protoporphyrinogen oxidase [Calditerrivibrio nitroreducens]|uniref:Coproporphyrinogen III oxidase n=1 Tax=Calditerrivibrio nitroreducens TaxID=477976 RepID=A0A2J6WQX6_9BACT|nr:MAG: protoporphyrinogen oxidase [Calditerrivibrio nitroreducens]